MPFFSCVSSTGAIPFYLFSAIQLLCLLISCGAHNIYTAWPLQKKKMRAFRFRVLAMFPACGIQRNYGNRGGSVRPPLPSRGRGQRGGGPPPGNRGLPNEPQIIARLLEHFPDKGLVPISKWATSLPDDLQEALVPYGGLSAFARSQVNFFIVRQENGVPVASLSPMGTELSRQHKTIERREQRRAEKLNEKRGRFGQRGRGAGPYIPPSQRTQPDLQRVK